MAYSIITVVGNGTSQYPINFTLGFNSRTEVKCRVDNEVDGLGDPVYRALTWINDGLVEVAGGPFDNTRTLVFSRTVDKTELIHDYGNGEEIEESNLDESNRQNLMAIHEVLDGRFESPLAQDLDMGGFKIVNMANGVSDDDAATIEQINAVLDNAANITIVATNIASVNTVAGIAANVTTVAGISANVTTVAGVSGNVTTVAGSISNVNTVATNIANVNTVAGIASDGDITALAGLTGTGIAVRTASNTWTTRQVTVSAGMSITNPAGIAGDIAIALGADLIALEALATTGIPVRTASDTWTQRTIIGTTAQITVTNGDGVAGNPTLSFPSSIQWGTGHTTGNSSRLAMVGGRDHNVTTGSSSDGHCFSGGSGNVVSSPSWGENPNYCHLTGSGANAYRNNMDVHGGGTFSGAKGEIQSSEVVLYGATLNATPTGLRIAGSQRLFVPSGTGYTFDIQVIGLRSTGAEMAWYRFIGGVKNNGGTTALVGSVVSLGSGEDTVAWDCAVTADDTNDSLEITVTGEAAKTIRWVATARMTETKI